MPKDYDMSFKANKEMFFFNNVTANVTLCQVHTPTEMILFIFFQAIEIDFSR